MKIRQLTSGKKVAQIAKPSHNYVWGENNKVQKPLNPTRQWQDKEFFIGLGLAGRTVVTLNVAFFLSGYAVNQVHLIQVCLDLEAVSQFTW